MAERRFGSFMVDAKLGSGAMGVVYRARHDATGQTVALKLLAPGLADNERQVARFERELEILQRLNHPNIVRCLGGGKLGEHHFLVMEIVEGGSLAALISRRGRLQWEQAVQFGMQICGALEHAHRHGIIHRDLKPSNLLLTKAGMLKLGDFGLARDVDATGLTATGKTMGTFAYMAPEQISGAPPMSHRTDLYALGCVLFEMLTGRPPFRAEEPAQVFYQHLEAKPPRVASLAMDCPVWLDALVAQLLEKDPDRRPLDAIHVLQGLQEVEANVQLEASTMRTHGGQASAISMQHDVTEARKLLGPKKKKRRAASGPIFERAWFLATCLSAGVALAAWAFWPKSERALFAKAEALMQTDDASKWHDARDKYLLPLVRRFPNGQYVEQARQYIDKVEMVDAEARFRTNVRLGRDAKSEAERLFGKGWRFEQFGDRVSAIESHRSMVKVLEGRDSAGSDERAFVNLAKRQIASIEQAGGDKDDRRQIVSDALDRADKLYAEGSTIPAREIWHSIDRLYSSNREMEPLVKRARAKLAGREEDAGDVSP